MMKTNPVQGIKERFRGFGFKQWFLLLLNVILVIGAMASALGLRSVAGTLDALNAADRFRGSSEERFSQIACYMPVDGGASLDSVMGFRRGLDARMVEASLEAPANGRLYVDAYSGQLTVNVSTDGGNASARAIAVGGDFFLFHPMPLRSGSYISSRDIMDDLVVLDEAMAWRMYGSVNVVGMPIAINGKPFVIAGVVSREDDFATRKAYSGDAGLFISYAAYERLSEDASISCYEIVMPDPISGFAKNMVAEGFPVNGGDIVENTCRYSVRRLFQLLGQFGERSMRTNGVIYPYWENAARLTEDYAALLLVVTILLALCPAGFVLVFVIRLVIRGYRGIKTGVPAHVQQAVERRREAKLEREYEKKAKGE